jgi:hypothetical protein
VEEDDEEDEEELEESFLFLGTDTISFELSLESPSRGGEVASASMAGAGEGGGRASSDLATFGLLTAEPLLGAARLLANSSSAASVHSPNMPVVNLKQRYIYTID